MPLNGEKHYDKSCCAEITYIWTGSYWTWLFGRSTKIKVLYRHCYCNHYVDRYYIRNTTYSNEIDPLPEGVEIVSDDTYPRKQDVYGGIIIHIEKGATRPTLR